MPQIITANSLIDGAVVYRSAGGDWVPEIDRAGLLDSRDAVATAEAAADLDVAAARVIDLAVIDVRIENGSPVPTRLRERIRAFGPTVKSDHRADLKPVASL